MGETYVEQLSRVRLMASGSATWDLSHNDIAALKAVLEHLDAYAMEAMATRQEIAELRKKLTEWQDQFGAQESPEVAWLDLQVLRELRKDKARLEYLFNLRSPYFSRGRFSVALIETDCGAMRIVGEGRNERAAIDNAMEAK